MRRRRLIPVVPAWGAILLLGLSGLGVSPALAAGQATISRGTSGLGSGMASRVRGVAEVASRSLVRVIRGEEVPGKSPTRLIGTGISLGPGRILTCAGVVGSAREVLVAAVDGDTLTATVTGVDRRSNLALLNAPGFSLPEMTVREKALIFPGEWVIAVGLGSPGTPSATFGAVVVGDGPSLGYSEIDMVETTCPVFRGYTGGALLDLSGSVVGILSGVMRLDPDDLAVPEGSDLVAGILYEGSLVTMTPTDATVAIPGVRAMQIADELQENGTVRRGYLGLQVELSAQAAARPYGARRGILVHQVVEAGPAARAGLLPGDFITEFGGTRVRNPDDLSFLVASRVPGSLVTVRYLRRGHQGVANVVLDQAPALDWTPSMDDALAGKESDSGRVSRVR